MSKLILKIIGLALDIAMFIFALYCRVKISSLSSISIFVVFTVALIMYSINDIVQYIMKLKRINRIKRDSRHRKQRADIIEWNVIGRRYIVRVDGKNYVSDKDLRGVYYRNRLNKLEAFVHFSSDKGEQYVEVIKKKEIDIHNEDDLSAKYMIKIAAPILIAPVITRLAICIVRGDSAFDVALAIKSGMIAGVIVSAIAVFSVVMVKKKR